MKPISVCNFFKVSIALAALSLGSQSLAATMMMATAKDGTVLSFSMPKAVGDDTELLIQSPGKKVKKYLIYMPLINGQIKFQPTVICQRNCANAKPETPGLPLKGSYQKGGDQLLCVKNCKGIESGLAFVVKN